MINIHKKLNTEEKLSILSQDSQYDLACSCGINDADRRHRSNDDTWIYPVTLPNRGKTFLFKTLISNVCINDCKYCPLRGNRDPKRCTLESEEVVKSFFDYYYKGKVMGLFLSSGVIGSPDKTMDRINQIAARVRKKGFKGYIHLKVIPGASNAAVEEAITLGSAVSINIETAGEKTFKTLCSSKDYLEDVIRPLKVISRLTAKGSKYSKVRQTTQFVVGAADDTDRDLVKYSGRLYQKLGLSRIYFSAYQRGLGENDLPGEQSLKSNGEVLTREHRLYQVDWLIRKYGFSVDEIPFEKDGNLSLEYDPKEVWARNNPGFFPLNINQADKDELMRVPGLGLVTVNFILNFRKQVRRFRSLEDFGKLNKSLKKAEQYLRFS